MRRAELNLADDVLISSAILPGYVIINYNYLLLGPTDIHSVFTTTK